MRRYPTEIQRYLSGDFSHYPKLLYCQPQTQPGQAAAGHPAIYSYRRSGIMWIQQRLLFQQTVQGQGLLPRANYVDILSTYLEFDKTSVTGTRYMKAFDAALFDLTSSGCFGH